MLDGVMLSGKHPSQQLWHHGITCGMQEGPSAQASCLPPIARTPKETQSASPFFIAQTPGVRHAENRSPQLGISAGSDVCQNHPQIQFAGVCEFSRCA